MNVFHAFAPWRHRRRIHLNNLELVRLYAHLLNAPGAPRACGHTDTEAEANYQAAETAARERGVARPPPRRPNPRRLPRHDGDDTMNPRHLIAAALLAVAYAAAQLIRRDRARTRTAANLSTNNAVLAEHRARRHPDPNAWDTDH